jgi:hypothetical protein
MAATTRSLAALLLLSGTLGGLEAAWPTWLDDLVNGRHSGSAGAHLVSPPSRDHAIIAERLEAKARVMNRFLTGQLTLFETAAWFRHLNATPPDKPNRGWQKFPGQCDGEKMCRHVISWAEIDLRNRAPSADPRPRVRAWQGELESHLRRHGRVVLPEFVPG